MLDRSAFTLLELLIAIAISVVVVSILYAVYHAVVRSTETGEHFRSVIGTAMKGLDTISRDIQTAYATDAGTNCLFRLEDRSTPGSNDAVLEFCATRAGETAPDARWYEVHRVRYERVRDGGTQRLVRVYGAPARGEEVRWETQVVARHVAGWQVEVYDGERWTRSWSGTSGALLPRAARVRITIEYDGAQRELDTTVLIPAGSGSDLSSDTATNLPGTAGANAAIP